MKFMTTMRGTPGIGTNVKFEGGRFRRLPSLFDGDAMRPRKGALETMLFWASVYF